MRLDHDICPKALQQAIVWSRAQIYFASAATCTATTKAGAACRAPAIVGADRCLNHSTNPEVEAARAAGRKAGGKARARQLIRATVDDTGLEWGELEDMDDIETAQRFVAAETLAGRMGARDSAAATRALTALARSMRDADRAMRGGDGRAR